MHLPTVRLLSASLLLGALLCALPAQAADDMRRFPPVEPSSTSDAQQLEDLRELLRQAQELQKTQHKVEPAASRKAAEVAGRGHPALSPAAPAPASPDDTSKSKKTAATAAEAQEGAERAAQNEGAAADGAVAVESAEASGADEQDESSGARPGCMYRGTKLIWEKVPGTCQAR